MKSYFVGIDFSANTFNAALLGKKGEQGCTLLAESKFTNDSAGVSSLLDWIKQSLCSEATFSNVLLCGEDTGTYSHLG